MVSSLMKKFMFCRVHMWRYSASSSKGQGKKQRHLLLFSKKQAVTYTVCCDLYIVHYNADFQLNIVPTRKSNA